MAQILYLTPKTAYQTFEQGHLGFVVPKGLLMLKAPRDLHTCVVVTSWNETVWTGHANSPEALAMMQQTEGFALITRYGIDNPYTAIDFSAFEGSFDIPTQPKDLDLETLPEEVLLAADTEVQAFIAGQVGYRVFGGVLKVQTPGDPDSCVLEHLGQAVWYGNAFSDEAHDFIEQHEGIVELRVPAAMEPLQA